MANQAEFSFNLHAACKCTVGPQLAANYAITFREKIMMQISSQFARTFGPPQYVFPKLKAGSCYHT